MLLHAVFSTCFMVTLLGEQGCDASVGHVIKRDANTCNKRNLRACLEQRPTDYIELCRKKHDGSRYDYEGAVECVERILAGCPTDRRTVTGRLAKDAIVQLKVCQAAYRCRHGERVVRHLYRCDLDHSENAPGMEFCKLTQRHMNCESRASKNCSDVHSVLHSRWLTTSNQEAERCEDLMLPGAGNIIMAGHMLLFLVFMRIFV